MAVGADEPAPGHAGVAVAEDAVQLGQRLQGGSGGARNGVERAVAGGGARGRGADQHDDVVGALGREVAQGAPDAFGLATDGGAERARQNGVDADGAERREQGETEPGHDDGAAAYAELGDGADHSWPPGEAHDPSGGRELDAAGVGAAWLAGAYVAAWSARSDDCSTPPGVGTPQRGASCPPEPPRPSRSRTARAAA